MQDSVSQARRIESDWNVERFGAERPVARHDWNTLVAERDRYMKALERIIAEEGCPHWPESGCAHAMRAVARVALEGSL